MIFVSESDLGVVVDAGAGVAVGAERARWR